MLSRLLQTVSNRRAFLGASAALPLAPLVAGTALAQSSGSVHSATHFDGMTSIGNVDHDRNGFDPNRSRRASSSPHGPITDASPAPP